MANKKLNSNNIPDIKVAFNETWGTDEIKSIEFGEGITAYYTGQFFGPEDVKLANDVSKEVPVEVKWVDGEPMVSLKTAALLAQRSMVEVLNLQWRAFKLSSEDKGGKISIMRYNAVKTNCNTTLIWGTKRIEN